MKKYADYIDRVEIQSLWSGRKHIVWKLQPGVNVLSGPNGQGKSTILNRLAQQLARLDAPVPASGVCVPPPDAAAGGVEIGFAPAEADCIRYDIIRSFDRPLTAVDALGRLGDGRVVTELDLQLHLLQRRYLDYQVDLGNRIIALLQSGDAEKREMAAAVPIMKNYFQDTVDELFGETGKHIDRQSNELRFVQYDAPLSPYQLSSGEKQLLVILLTALCQDGRSGVLLMDEPEASLHFEWQKQLISTVRHLNPRAQIILTTHSPALIMDGWSDAVTEVSEITQ